METIVIGSLDKSTKGLKFLASMETKALKFLSTKLRKATEKFDKINSGGCAVFAEMLSVKLNALNVDHKIVYLVDNFRGDKKEKFNEIVSDKSKFSNLELNSNGIYCLHMMIDIDGKLVDCDGVHESLSATIYDGYICGELTTKQCNKISYNDEDVYTWNKMFDRGQIPDMKKSLDNLFKNVTFSNGLRSIYYNITNKTRSWKV